MTPRIVLIAAMVAIGVYTVYELRVWARDTEGAFISRRQRRIRSIGLVLLFSALSMWIYGTYLPIPNTDAHPMTKAAREAATRFIGYWMFTLLLTVPLIPLALLDTRENLLRAAEERRKIFREAMSVMEDVGDSEQT